MLKWDVANFETGYWKDYWVRAQYNGIVRRLFTWTFFKHDWFPCFDTTYIDCDLIIRRNSKGMKRLNYIWKSERLNDTTVLNESLPKGKGIAEIQHSRIPKVLKHAINIGRLDRDGKYILYVKLSSDIDGSSDFMPIGRFTIRNHDDFDAQILWPALWWYSRYRCWIHNRPPMEIGSIIINYPEFANSISIDRFL